MKMGLPEKKTDRHYTYGDYRRWPEDERWELIDGVAWNMSPAPRLSHQRILANLWKIFQEYFVGKSCEAFIAPVDVFLPSGPVSDEDEVDTVVQPDLIVVCDGRKLSEKGCFGAPDLTVEILSPSTSAKDMTVKHRIYERSGVREYWIVDPANRVVHRFVLRDGKFDEAVSHVYDEKHVETFPASVFDGLIVNPAVLFEPAIPAG